MPTESLIALIANAGGTLGLAIFAIWMLNRTWEARLDEAKANAAEKAEQRRELLDALNRNTEVVTTLCERFGDK